MGSITIADAGDLNFIYGNRKGVAANVHVFHRHKGNHVGLSF
jgi:hypothetical protein